MSESERLIVVVFLAVMAFVCAFVVVINIWIQRKERIGSGAGASAITGIPESCLAGVHSWRYIGSPPLARQCKILPCGKLEYLNTEQHPEGFDAYMDWIHSGQYKKDLCVHGMLLTKNCHWCKEATARLSEEKKTT